MQTHTATDASVCKKNVHVFLQPQGLLIFIFEVVYEYAVCCGVGFASFSGLLFLSSN